jgi:hypothetical protein
VSHIFGAITDKALLEHERNRALKIGSAEVKGVTESKSNSFSADVLLWDELCIGVEGYGDPEESLPNNWKTLVDEEDKATAIQTLLACEAIRSTQAKQRAAFKPFGKKEQPGVVRLRAYFNGREVELEHYFRPKDGAAVTAWKELSSRIWFGQGEHLGESDTQIPPQLEDKAALYDRMASGHKGYSGRVPLHHKALAVSEFFGAETLQKKKSNGLPS